VNAADYGVPQSRKRVIIVAFRRDLGIVWQPPASTHSEAALLHSQHSGAYWEEHDLPLQPSVTSLPLYDGKRRWQTLRDATSDLPEPGEDKVEDPEWPLHIRWPGARSYQGHTPNDLDRPAKTVKAGVHGVAGGELVVRLDDHSIRYMTVREVARVMTFPDSWKLTGPRGEQMRQLGNAVPPRLGEVFASSIGRALSG
jgi:DNA (cytosine-5)-methyltransferase 1